MMLEKMRIGRTMQLWFAGPVVMLWLGIYLTGFEQVSFLIYLPAVMSLFAFLTGLCPGMMLVRLASGKMETEKV